jgi:hypothetical protein
MHLALPWCCCPRGPVLDLSHLKTPPAQPHDVSPNAYAGEMNAEPRVMRRSRRRPAQVNGQASADIDLAPACTTDASTSIGSGAPDADSCRRAGFEPFLSDRGPALLTCSVRTRVQPLCSGIDLLEMMFRLPNESFDL